MRKSRKFIASVAIAAVGVAGGAVPQALAAGSSIAGGGSSFMANMMDICGAQYNRNTNYNSNGDTISYTASGSGTGKTNFANGTYKFGGTESAYSSGAPSDLVYIPLIAGPIAVAYHLDGVSPSGATVRLSQSTLAKIFAGQITKWDDTAIKADNTAKTVAAVKKVTRNGVTATIVKSGTKVKVTVKATAAALKKFKAKKLGITRINKAGTSRKALYSKTLTASTTQTFTHTTGDTYAIKAGTTSLGSVAVDADVTGVTLTLPSTPIKVAYRSGNSGTTNMFVRFLNAAVPSVWTKSANDSFTSAFPGTVPSNGTFQSASGNDGVANYVKNNNGSITYAELSFVEERESAGVKAAAIMNNSGEYVVPTTAAASEFFAEAAVAASGLVTLDYTVKSSTAYLINAIAYGLSSSSASSDATAVKSFFSYFLNVCAPKNASGAGYAALSGSILAKALAQVAKIGG